MNQYVRKTQIEEHVSDSAKAKAVDNTKVETSNEMDEEYFNFSHIKIRHSTVFYVSKYCYAFVNIRFIEIFINISYKAWFIVFIIKKIQMRCTRPCAGRSEKNSQTSS